MVCKSDMFCKYLVEMSRGITNNTLLSKEMLLASKLVSLHQPNGSVRPTAVGGLFYRVWAKAILTTTFKLEFLLPFQMGMMSSGGVEPIIRAAERAIKGAVNGHHTYILPLDAI